MKVFDCQHCQQPFQVGPEHAGMAVACPACGQANRIAADAFAPSPQTSKVFACPSCQGQFQVPLSMNHSTVACPHCQKPVSVKTSESDSTSRSEADDIEAVPSVKPKQLKSRKSIKKSKAKRRGDQPFVPPKDDLFAPGFQDGKKADREKPVDGKPVSVESREEPQKVSKKTAASKSQPQSKRAPAKSPDGAQGRLTPPPKPKSTPAVKGKSEASAKKATKSNQPTDAKLKVEAKAKPKPKLEAVSPAGKKEEAGKTSKPAKRKKKNSAGQKETKRTEGDKAKAKTGSKDVPKPSAPVKSKKGSAKPKGQAGSIPQEKKVVDAEVVKPQVTEQAEVAASEKVAGKATEKATVANAPVLPKKQAEPAKVVEPETDGDSSSRVDSVVADVVQPPIIGKQPIDHLLPPKFDVVDPQRLTVSLARDDNKVFLPDAEGGTVRVDKRIVHVTHGQEKVSLVVLSSEQRERRRLIQNSIVILIGMLLIAATIWMLLN